jgi:hypothetical protein
MRRAVALAVAAGFSLSPTLASAQEPDASTLSQVGQPILPHAHAVDVLPHARSQADFDAWTASWKNLPARPVRPNLAPRPTMGDAAYQAAKAAADALRHSGSKPSQLSGIGPLVAPGTIITNKPGPNQALTGDGYYPPDSTGAIGTTQVVIPVNQTLNVYNRGGKLLKSTPFGAFFGTSDGLSDPRVQWDPLWSRWVLTDTRIPNPGDTLAACFYVAVSQTASATGAWNIYRPCISGGVFAAGDLWDYDMLGLSQDAILVTGNIFGVSSFKGPAVIAMPKALLYNGQGFSAPVYTLPTSVGTLTPPVVQDTNANAFFLANDSSGTVLDLYKGVNLSSEYQFSFTLQAQLATSYSVPPSAQQPGTSQVLDTLDGRFQQVNSQYGNTLWAVHTEGLGTYPAPKYFQIDTSANAIVQSGFFYESGTSDDFNPSIVANTAGSVFVTWSSTDALSSTGGQHNASIRFSGRQASDGAGIGAGSALFTSPVALTGNYQNGIQRWGDYSAVTLDPKASTCGAGQRAAVFNETIVNANEWGTQYGLIGFCP